MSEYPPFTGESSNASILEALPESKSSLGRVLGWCIDHSPALAPLAEIARMKAEPELPEIQDPEL